MTKSFFLSQRNLKRKFNKIGKSCKISNKASFIGERNIIIGDNVRIDDYTILVAFDGKIIIGSKEEDVLDLNLGNWNYASLQVDEMGVNLTHSGALLGFLYLEVGESHSFHSADTSTFLNIGFE